MYVLFFLFKQKTAYEMRISDWSSDVCSSDLVTKAGDITGAMKTCALAFGGVDIIVNNAGLSISKSLEDHTEKDWDILYDVLVKGQFLVTQGAEIGRASCRERVCQYV